MRHKLFRWIPAAAICVLPTLSVPVEAQELGQAALQEVKDRVLTELVRTLPDDLPEGYLAILPPEVDEPTAVDETVASSWAAAFAETLQARRPEVELTERTRLEAVLREQKFGDSAYADPETAVHVGKLAAARALLLTRLYAFRPESGRIRVHLEAVLLDVETGRNLWSKEISRGLLPSGLKWLLGGLVVLVGAPIIFLVARARNRRHRRLLAQLDLPRAREQVRIDVDGVLRSVVESRERLHRAGRREEATAVQTALVGLEPVLDRVRHALPGGSVDRCRAGDLEQALHAAKRIESLLEGLRTAADAVPDRDEPTVFVHRLERDSLALRGAVDTYRAHLS